MSNNHNHKQHREWRSVADELPDADAIGALMLCRNDSEVSLCQWDGEVFREMHNDWVFRPTHWTRIPTVKDTAP